MAKENLEMVWPEDLKVPSASHLDFSDKTHEEIWDNGYARGFNEAVNLTKDAGLQALERSVPTDLIKCVESCVESAYMWGESHGIDGIPKDRSGDSHNMYTRALSVHSKGTLLVAIAAHNRILDDELTAKTNRLDRVLQETRVKGRDLQRLLLELKNLIPNKDLYEQIDQIASDLTKIR